MTPLVTEHEGGVVRLRLNRPQVRNALDETLRDALAAAVEGVARDASTRVVVLEGAGPCFCSGADLGSLARVDLSALSWAERRRLAGGWQRVLEALEALPQVTVAAVRGTAIGGGLLLATACDLRISTATARFCVPEVQVGLPLTWAGVPRLVREVGLPMARDLVLTGRVLTGGEACAAGLVTRVVADDALDAAVDEVVAQLLGASPGALAVSKAAFAARSRAADGVAGWADPDLLATALAEPEARAMVAAYLASRAAPGRLSSTT